MNDIIIQTQMHNGAWVDVKTVINDDQQVSNALNETKRQYPDRRVRAVTFNGRLVDIMG